MDEMNKNNVLIVEVEAVLKNIDTVHQLGYNKFAIWDHFLLYSLGKIGYMPGIYVRHCFM